MIQVNELKIGNRFIRELHNSRGLEYDHDFVLTEEWMGKLFSGDISIALQDLFPIPLTNEVLLSYGFKSAYQSFHDGVSILNLHADRLDFQFNSEYDKGIAVSNKGEDEAIMYPCQSLHEIQNLYYCLCKQELNYQP